MMTPIQEIKKMKLTKNLDSVVDSGEDMAYFANTAVDQEEIVLDDLTEDEVEAAGSDYELFLQTIDNIRRGVAGGVITPEEGAAYQAEAVTELALRMSDNLDIDIDADDEYYDDEDEDAEYSAGYDLAEFSTGSGFGEALLELAAEEYEDPMDGLVELADTLGLSDEDVIALVQGVAAPDNELAIQIGEFFDTTADDEDAFLGLMALAENAQVEALEAEQYDEEDYEENEYDDEDDEALYSAYGQLENRLAEFEAATAVKDLLATADRKADRGLREGWLTPKAKQVLLGNFSREDDRLAMFSQACEINGVDPATQLFSIDYALSVFEKCGPFMTFGAYAEEPLTPEEAEFERSAEHQALLNFQLMKEQN